MDICIHCSGIQQVQYCTYCSNPVCTDCYQYCDKCNRYFCSDEIYGCNDIGHYFQCIACLEVDCHQNISNDYHLDICEKCKSKIKRFDSMKIIANNLINENNKLKSKISKLKTKLYYRPPLPNIEGGKGYTEALKDFSLLNDT